MADRVTAPDAREMALHEAKRLLGVADETQLGTFEEELVDCLRALLASPPHEPEADVRSDEKTRLDSFECWAVYGLKELPESLREGLDPRLLKFMAYWLKTVHDAYHEALEAKRIAATPAPAAADEEVREAAGRLGARLLAEWWENDCADLDGSSVQEIAEETGLWHQVEHHAPGVECEWCGNEGPCGELTEAGLAALASRGSSL